MNILVLGATGTFGGRLCDRLLNHTTATLVVASRNLARAKELANGLGERTCPVAVSLPTGIEAALDQSKPDLVIDASGPFQENDYEVPRAAATRGIHYLDLADAREYVCGIADLDALAKAKGAVVLSGASSVPALSSAVVDHLAEGLERVDSIDMGISTAGGVALGESVIRANLSCAGLPVRVRRGGAWGEITGWLKQRQRTLQVEGMPVLRRRLFAPTEVPDLDLLPLRYPDVKTVLFHGGSELRLLQYGLACLARLRKLRVLQKLDWLAPFLTRLCRLVAPFGSGRSGMYVDVTGQDQAHQMLRRSWTIIADEGDGLYVPTLAAVALTKRIASSDLPERGARPAAVEVTLDEFGPLFADLNIDTESVTEPLPKPVFQCGLGECYAELPRAVKELHQVYGVHGFDGRGSVERGDSFLAKITGWFLRLPPNMADCAVRVTIERKGEIESWQRDFGGHKFFSEMSNAGSDGDGRFLESFGLVSGILNLPVRDRQLDYECIGFRALGIPLPRFLAPKVNAYEREDERGRFRFFVEIRLPWSALIVRYKGWLLVD